MSHQSPLFYESVHDALRELVRVLGGAKAVGHLLWPGKSMQDAQTRLLNCLDHNRAEKLGPEELLLLLAKGNEAGCHVVMAYFNTECGYEQPRPRDPKEEKDKAVEAVQAAAEALHRASAALERVNASEQQARLRSVS